MQTLEDLRAAYAEIQNKISRIEHANRRTTNEQHVGKHFKYRNSYSCPEKPSDYWWLYVRITGLTSDGSLQYTEFQVDKYGEVTMKAKKQMYWLTDDYRPITAREFNTAWMKTQKAIKSLDPR